MEIKVQGAPAGYFTGSETVNQADKKAEPEESKIGIEDIKKAMKLDEDGLIQATELLNKAMKISNYHLEFKAYKNSGRYQVKVVDSETKKVIRELPPDDVLDFQTKVIAMLDEMIGLLVDEIA